MALVLRKNLIFSISLIAYNKSSTKTLLKTCKSIYQLLIILLRVYTTALRHPYDVSGVGFGSAYFVLCTQCFAYCITIFFIITGSIATYVTPQGCSCYALNLRSIFFINLINIYQHLLFIGLLQKLYILVERSFTHIID